MPQQVARRARSIRRGLTMIEVVASTMIVGLMSVAALNGLGAATRSAMSTGNRAIALGLADDLMSEILQVAYKDSADLLNFGPETGEIDRPGGLSDSDTANDLDDVDDYHGWIEDPPADRNGVPLPDRTGWRRTVTVQYVAVDDPAIIEDEDDTGAKRIRVVVEYNGLVLADQDALRTDTDE